jgi:hypothetical protein
MVKTSVISGVLGGLVFLPYYYFLYVTGNSPLGFLSISDIWIPALTILLALYFYRRNQPGGELHLWEGLIIGFIANTILAVMSGVSIYYFLEYIDTDGQMFRAYIDDETRKWILSKDEHIKRIGENAYQSILKDLGNVTFYAMGKSEFVRKIVYGFFMVPIISLILRKQVFNTTK